jgi:hypothetical protein
MAPSSQSAVLARLTLSALARATEDPEGWSRPEVHQALLVSGLSVLTQAAWLLRHDPDLA